MGTRVFSIGVVLLMSFLFGGVVYGQRVTVDGLIRGGGRPAPSTEASECLAGCVETWAACDGPSFACSGLSGPRYTCSDGEGNISPPNVCDSALDSCWDSCQSGFYVT